MQDNENINVPAKQSVSKRQQWEQAIRAKNPDKTYEDEDELYGDAMAGYDSVKDNLKHYEEDDKKLVELLEQHPEVMNFISTLASSGDFASAYAELPDYALMDDNERASYDKAVASKKAEREQFLKSEEARNNNIEKSTQVLQDWADRNGLTEEQVTDFIETIINKIADKFNSGNFDEEFFESLYRLMNYDNDVQASHDAGVIDGRNQAIGQRVQRRAQGDGLPEMTPGGGEQQPTQKEENPLVDTLRQSLSRNAIHQFNR